MTWLTHFMLKDKQATYFFLMNLNILVLCFIQRIQNRNTTEHSLHKNLLMHVCILKQIPR